MQIRFGMTCLVCDDGWSVVYGGVRFMQRVTPDTTGEAQRAAVWWAIEIMVSWSRSVLAWATSWRGAFKRGHEIQSREGVSSDRQGSQWIEAW